MHSHAERKQRIWINKILIMSEIAFKHTKATKKKQAQKNQKNDFT